MALNFQFYQKTKVLVGAGAVKQLGELADLIGGRKALVVADPGIVSAGIAQKVLDVLKENGKEVSSDDGCGSRHYNKVLNLPIYLSFVCHYPVKDDRA